MSDHQSDHDLLISLHTEVKGMRQDIRDFKTNFVTKTEFEPVRGIVYGMVTVILLAVVGSLIAVVIQ